jgi:hypothetical protein
MDFRLLLLVLVAAPVGAADVRVLNMGDACAGVEAKEAALGSKTVSWEGTPREYAHAFEVSEFGRDVVVMYWCQKGRLFTGNYRFPWEELNAAATSFRSVHDHLLEMYGTPFLDSSPWHVRDAAQPAIIASQPSQYMSEWRTSRVLAHLMIAHDRRDDGSLGWRVWLVIGPPGMQMKPK